MKREKLHFNVSAKGFLLTGREDGNTARKQHKLEEIDSDDKLYDVTFPKNIEVINTSFFLGCFGRSVVDLGEEKFRDKYHFVEINENMEAAIDDGISRALKTNLPL